MVNDERIKKMLYGGDYNPEQWSRDVWEEDMRMFKLANIDIVTINVFSWATLQPSEDVYDFSQLDDIVELVTKNDMKICFATSTGAHPAWLAKRYPEVLRVDFEGRKRKFGGRHNSCPNSLVFQKYSSKLASKLSERYHNNDNIVAWHISNEYGGECYCENCEKAFRVWLKNKYGTIENVNKAWNTSFWGHTFYEFDEIVAPSMLSEHHEYDGTAFQGISLDYRRFNSDSILNNYKLERDAIKEFDKKNKITTNFMVMFKTLNYQDWAKEMDFVCLDNYPSVDSTVAGIALAHELIRGLKPSQPYILMEQTPSVTNWQQYNKIRRPNEMRLLSYQAVAHGSDAVMFFQMRRSIGASEKYHGAVIDHCGHENTRAFREVSQLGKELSHIGDKTLGSVADSKVAILFDWDNWWAIELSSGPNARLSYVEEVLKYYTALHNKNVNVDVIGIDENLSKYDVVIAPIMYMVKGNDDEKIREYVKAGGTFVTTFFSGYVNENDLVTLGGYPGKLRDILGIWVEEIDSLPPYEHNSFLYNDKRFTADMLCDVLHLETAKSLSEYESDFYAGYPVVTRNELGKGLAYYVATSSEESFYDEFVGELLKEKNIASIIVTSNEVEVVSRSKGDDEFVFILNHSKEMQSVTLAYDGVDIITDTVYKKDDVINMQSKDVIILNR